MKNLNIASYWKIFLIFYFVLSVVSFCVISLKPFKKSIEFSGGVVFEIKTDDISEIKTQYPDSIVVKLKETYTIKFPKSFNIEDVDFSNATTLSSFSVSPVITSGLIKKSFIAVALSLASIFFYIFVRFNFYYSLGAIFTLMTDVLMTLLFVNLCKIEIGISTIAGILTIVGYSINDTVIIYDKIRQKVSHKKLLTESIDGAIKLTLARTIGTSFTTLLAILPVIIFASGSIQSFCLVIFFGVFVGTISSVAVSSSILVLFEDKIMKILKIKEEISAI